MSEARDAERGPGRPRLGDAVAPSTILDAAVDALSNGGFETLSMRGVARAAGVSLATVQHHFGNKAGLGRAAVDHVLAEANRERVRTPGRDLRQRIRNLLEVSSSRPGVLAALLNDKSPGHEERLAYFTERFSAILQDPATTLAEVQAGRTGRPVDAGAFMALLTIGVSSLGGVPDAIRKIYGIDLSTDEDLDRLADHLTDIIGHGIFETPDA